jgi:hypothetical protein
MMKRRGFIVRTFTAALSASVFTASGWLMGTRTLTMPSFPTPGNGTANNLTGCQGGDDNCGPGQCDFNRFCMRSQCYPNCAWDLYYWLRCNTSPGCNVGYCRLTIVYGNCTTDACATGPYCP